MDMNTINALNAYQFQSGKTTQIKNMTTQKPVTLDYIPKFDPVSTTDEDGVVLEKSDLIKALQNDAAARTKQMRDFVIDTLRKQAGLTIGDKEDDVWQFLASGNYTVTEAAKEAAKEAISEDGYYGVEQTSTRILEFAKALSGGDTSKADELLDAFKKGFKEATKSWGKELPEISQKTYKAVEEKFDAWKNDTKETTENEN